MSDWFRGFRSCITRTTRHVTIMGANSKFWLISLVLNYLRLSIGWQQLDESKHDFHLKCHKSVYSGKWMNNNTSADSNVNWVHHQHTWGGRDAFMHSGRVSVSSVICLAALRVVNEIFSKNFNQMFFRESERCEHWTWKKKKVLYTLKLFVVYDKTEETR